MIMRNSMLFDHTNIDWNANIDSRIIRQKGKKNKNRKKYRIEEFVGRSDMHRKVPCVYNANKSIDLVKFINQTKILFNKKKKHRSKEELSSITLVDTTPSLSDLVQSSIPFHTKLKHRSRRNRKSVLYMNHFEKDIVLTESTSLENVLLRIKRNIIQENMTSALLFNSSIVNNTQLSLNNQKIKHMHKY